MPWTEEARRKAGETMRERLKDPAFAAWASEHGKKLCAMMHADPAIAARRRERVLAAAKRNYADPDFRARVGCLPPMTAEEKRLYHKLTSNGATRADALKVLGKAA